MTKNNSIILSHPTGNANVRAVANAFLAKEILFQFHTSIATYPGNFWDYLAKMPFLAEFARRSFDHRLKPYTRTSPWRELGRTFHSKVGLKFLNSEETGFFSIDKVYGSQDKSLATFLASEKKSVISAVYAYEDGALETFLQAKQVGIKCIYDLPIAYWETSRRLIEVEALRLPQWSGTLGGIKDSQAKLDRKQHELELADVVVGPSTFVMNSLPSWSRQKKLIISAFGSPPASLESVNQSNHKKRPKDPLRVLFVGSMGQRKGLGDLFEAIKLLKDPNVELIVLGSLLAPMEFYRNELPNFRYEAGRPHQEVLALMRSCDVFCLPSIVEGRALVMQEAMSQGLPLIITANTGGEDLIQEGETGFLVPIRSPVAIAEKLQWFLDNKSQIPVMSKKARAHSQNYTWEKYGDTIVNELLNYLN